jgi:cytochrome c oxidase cbb3-type subunit 2
VNHDLIERNVGLMAVLTAVAISFGGLVEIVPLMNQKSATEPAVGLPMRTALEVVGREVYLREGCYNCHSQQVRSLAEEVLRYGPASQAGESAWDHPFQWGSKRTGPDLARVGGRYSEEWHRLHLTNPRDVVPESNMPGYPWLNKAKVESGEAAAMMTALRRVGVPFTDQDIAAADASTVDHTHMEALIAYLQTLKVPQPPVASPAAAETPAADTAQPAAEAAPADATSAEPAAEAKP